MAYLEQDQKKIDAINALKQLPVMAPDSEIIPIIKGTGLQINVARTIVTGMADGQITLSDGTFYAISQRIDS